MRTRRPLATVRASPQASPRRCSAAPVSPTPCCAVPVTFGLGVVARLDPGADAEYPRSGHQAALRCRTQRPHHTEVNMAHLLHIDSSARTTGSTSRQLTAEFAAHWATTHPGGTVAYRDLA